MAGCKLALNLPLSPCSFRPLSWRVCSFGKLNTHRLLPPSRCCLPLWTCHIFVPIPAMLGFFFFLILCCYKITRINTGCLHVPVLTIGPLGAHFLQFDLFIIYSCKSVIRVFFKNNISHSVYGVYAICRLPLNVKVKVKVIL